MSFVDLVGWLITLGLAAIAWTCFRRLLKKAPCEHLHVNPIVVLDEVVAWRCRKCRVEMPYNFKCADCCWQLRRGKMMCTKRCVKHKELKV